MGACYQTQEEFEEGFRKFLEEQTAGRGDISAEMIQDAWNKLADEFMWNDYLSHVWKGCETCRFERIRTEQEEDLTIEDPQEPPQCSNCDESTNWKGWQIAYDSLLKLDQMDLDEKKILLMFVLKSFKLKDMPTAQGGFALELLKWAKKPVEVEVEDEDQDIDPEESDIYWQLNLHN